MNPSVQEQEASRIAENLLLCGELTDLCLHLRLAVLKQECSEEEANRKLWGEIIESKERAWPRNPF